MYSIDRVEYKYILTKLEISNLQKYLYSVFKPIYKMRKITSIYYDNNELESFHDSEEGIAPRKKIRIRNYDDLNKFNLEIKYHKYDGRSKISKPIDNIKYRIYDDQYGNCKPKLRVSYFRYYFLHQKNNQIRLTIDLELSFNNIKNQLNLKNTFKNKVVVELKAPNQINQNTLDNIIPLRKIRFSKYCEGIKIFYNKDNFIQ